MKYIYKISLLLLLPFINGCLDFDNLRQNPNDPVQVPPNLLFTEVTPLPVSAFSGTYRYPQYHNFIAADLGVSPPVDYRFGSTDFNYGIIRDIDRMEIEAERTGAEVYKILGKFLRAYNYVSMSRDMGDVPLSEAMKGQENPQPAYDTQKSVYLQCLNWLDETNQEMNAFISSNAGFVLEGDIYFNGDLTKWQKAINAFTVRVILSLSNHIDDSDLQLKSRLGKLIQSPESYPLMEGNFDNMLTTHKDEDGFRPEYNPNSQIIVEGTVMASTFIDLLKKYKDPRIRKVAEPTPKAIEEGGDTEAVWNDFDSYNGSDIALDLEENNAMKQKGEFSPPNKERFLSFVGQPSILLSYWEQELYLAEAANQGWINSDAKNHYENGVRASMKFFNVSEENIEEYLTVNAPYLNGKVGLDRIHEQLYLALAENSGWQSFFITRRTGIPEYSYSSINNVDMIPIRWEYPNSEDTENRENYRAALIRQFGKEVDSRNGQIWLLQK